MASSKNFTSNELRCSCCGDEHVQQWALDKLQAIREELGRPLSVTSAYRCENHPVESRKKKAGTHNKGIAFDIFVGDGALRYQLISTAIKHGANGVGVSRSFIHIDFRDTTPVVWTYK